MQSYISKIDDIKLSDLKWADGKDEVSKVYKQSKVAFLNFRKYRETYLLYLN